MTIFIQGLKKTGPSQASVNILSSRWGRYLLNRGVAWLLLAGMVFPAGCGYTTRSAMPSRFHSIFIEDMKNNIDFTTEGRRNLYYPLLEVKIKKAIISRFLFDGNLRVAEPVSADLILKGELVNYDRYALRYTDDNDVQEYRVQVVMNLTMVDRSTNETVWQENGFTGESTYFLSGPGAKSENAALDDAVLDLARRVVERTVENW